MTQQPSVYRRHFGGDRTPLSLNVTPVLFRPPSTHPVNKSGNKHKLTVSVHKSRNQIVVNLCIFLCSRLEDPRNFNKPGSVGARTLQAFLDCDLQSLDLGTLTHFHLVDSVSTRPYFQCLREHPGLFGITRCLPLMFKTCRSAAMTSVKTIRFRMTQAARQLRDDSMVKVS